MSMHAYRHEKMQHKKQAGETREASERRAESKEWEWNRKHGPPATERERERDVWNNEGKVPYRDTPCVCVEDMTAKERERADEA